MVWKGKGFKYFESPREVKSQDVSCWTRDLYDAPHNTSLSSAIPVPSHKTFHTHTPRRITLNKMKKKCIRTLQPHLHFNRKVAVPFGVL